MWRCWMWTLVLNFDDGQIHRPKIRWQSSLSLPKKMMQRILQQYQRILRWNRKNQRILWWKWFTVEFYYYYFMSVKATSDNLPVTDTHFFKLNHFRILYFNESSGFLCTIILTMHNKMFYRFMFTFYVNTHKAKLFVYTIYIYIY